MILIKADSNTVIPLIRGSESSNFAVSPPSGGRPSRPLSGVNPYPITPKVVDQGLGVEANPAGAGGGDKIVESDEQDTCLAPQKQ